MHTDTQTIEHVQAGILAGRIAYIVIDGRTKERATPTLYRTRAAARRAVDKCDAAYGGYRYTYQTVAITE